MESVTQRIKFAMSIRGLTQASLARRIKKNPAYVSSLLSRQSDPRADNLQLIAEGLAVSVEWLTSGKGSAPSDGDGIYFGELDRRKRTHVRPTSKVIAADEGKDESSPTGHAAVKQKPLTVIVKEDRYPNRRKAIETARSLGAPEEALKNVESMLLKGSDMTEIEWLDEIKTEVRRIKRGLHQIEERADDLSLEDPESTGDTTLDAMRELERLKAEEENNR